MGYSAEAPMEKEYRDCRILRLYEGTNEINRLVMVTMFVKNAMTKFDLQTPATALR